jgi:putative membrane protein
MWHMHDLGWGWWVLMSVGMVAVWSLLIYGIVLVARGAIPGRRPERPDESPKEVLRRRLAAGELSVQEYELLRRVLDEQATEAST